MLKKLLLILILFFTTFSTSNADWKTDIDKGDYKLFSEVYPDKQNIYEFESVKLNEKGEFVIEYKKDHYERLLKVYGGREILIFDPTNKDKYKLNAKTEFKGDSVFITILKDEKLDLEINSYLKKGSSKNTFNSFTDRFYIYIIGELLGNNIDKETEKIIGNLILKGNFNKINELLDKKYLEQGYGVHNGKIIFRGDVYSEVYKSFYNKYKNHLILRKGYVNESFLGFSIKDKDKIIDFLKDYLYYIENGYVLRIRKSINKNNLIISNNDLIIEGINFLDSNSLNIYFFKKNKRVFLYCNIYKENDTLCHIGGDEKYYEKIFKYKDFIQKFTYKNNYINISELIRYFKDKGFFLGNSKEDIYRLSFNNNNNNFGYPEEDILPIVSKIKSPKNVSTNPYLVSVNFILALLYLLAFYFTTQLFNSYFEELASKNKWNEKISNFTIKYLKLPFERLYIFLLKISKNKKIPKLKLYINKTKNFTKKHEHHIYIILGFLLLGIIGQIVVDDFDILSLKGWATIFIMIFILAFITIFKDLLLYFFNKNELKNKIKLENMPLGFIFAGIVAIFGRWIGLIPGVMFGSVIKLNPKDSIAERKTTKPKLLFDVLLIVFLFGLSCWLLTILFDSSSFIYKFLIVTYFGLINDVFFALLPFGMLWGIFILKDKKLKVKWFILTFVIFFFLLHTIMNADGDLNKLLQFDGNFAILVLILFFWMIITSGLYYKTKKANEK